MIWPLSIFLNEFQRVRVSTRGGASVDMVLRSRRIWRVYSPKSAAYSPFRLSLSGMSHLGKFRYWPRIGTFRTGIASGDLISHPLEPSDSMFE